MFREVSHLKDDHIGQNHLKNLRAARIMFCDDNDVSWSHLEFLLWAYDKEFWTINYAADEYGFNKKNFGNRILWPLMKDKLVFKYYDKLTPSDKLEDHLFREETKYNYRVRYAITQRARMIVQAFYRRLGN
mgnify:FL=1|jgi:hypothetical protein|tara:strand:- start:71 stop:463 length:393 start_codon:yes stop_codon:yes gene_type:complete